MDSTDTELFCHYQERKDEAAFKELYERYATSLMSHIESKVDNVVAEDIAQRTWSAACKYLKPVDNFKAWLYTIATNEARKHNESLIRDSETFSRNKERKRNVEVPLFVSDLDLETLDGEPFTDQRELPADYYETNDAVNVARGLMQSAHDGEILYDLGMVNQIRVGCGQPPLLDGEISDKASFSMSQDIAMLGAFADFHRCTAVHAAELLGIIPPWSKDKKKDLAKALAKARAIVTNEPVSMHPSQLSRGA